MPTCKEQLDSLKEEIMNTNATLTSPKSNINYVKLNKGKTPIYSLMIPNKLFLLWQKHRELQGQIGQQPSSFIALATHSVHGISLKADSEALEKRLQSESSRFRANYRKKGGPARKAFLLRNMNILLMEDDILPPSSTNAQVESTASTAAAAADNIEVTVTTQLNTSTATLNITTFSANTTTTTTTDTITNIVNTTTSTTTTTAAAAVQSATAVVTRFATASTTTTGPVHEMPSPSTIMTDVAMMISAPMVTSANNLILSTVTSKSYATAMSRSTPMVSTVVSGSTVNLPNIIERSSRTVSRNAPVTYSNITVTSSVSSATVVSFCSCTSSYTNIPSLSTPLSTSTAIPASISTPVIQGSGSLASHEYMPTSSSYRVLQLQGMLCEYRTYIRT